MKSLIWKVLALEAHSAPEGGNTHMQEEDSALILQSQWFPERNKVLAIRVPGCACCHSRDELNSSKESGGSQVGHSLSVKASRALD